MSAPLVLASASPRRRELLARVGVPLEVRPARADERVRPGEEAIPYARRVAGAKAAEVAAARPGRWILGADTVVEIDGEALGKAASETEARQMLARLAGRAHRVTTAFCLLGPSFEETSAVTTEVVMRAAPAGELDAYVAAGEWRGKAGAYAVQGMAAALVAEARGSITNVIGLPLAEVVEALARAGAPGPRYREGVPA